MPTARIASVSAFMFPGRGSPGSAGERLAGRRRFALLWRLGTDGQWRLSRVFDYGYRPPEQESPPASAR